MAEEEIEANAASDPDNPPWTEEDFRNARMVQPGSASKPVIWVHVDEDVCGDGCTSGPAILTG